MDTVVALFEAQVKRTPHEVAVWHNHETLSYAQLNQQANQLAHYLRFLGVQPEYLVGICLPRSIGMMVAVLGILKAGATYVPFDPYYPEKRLAYMLEDSQLKCLLLTRQTRHTLSRLTPNNSYYSVDLEQDASRINQQPSDNLAQPVSTNHLAYCLYTSGSTGLPKAVLMTHLPLANLIHWHLQYRITPARQLQFSPISFDISAQEIFATWCSGGCLFSIEEQIRRNPLALLNFINAHQIEKLYLPFTPLQQLAIVAHDSGNYPHSVKEVITAGEQLQITTAIRAFFQYTQATLHHHYGATECQDVTTLTLTGSPESWPLLPSVGKSITNIQTYILNEAGQPVTNGEAGKLFIGGDGIACGYLHRPELTTKKFIPNPFGEGRLYDTSDNARYLPSGNIELLGRSDETIKIRGFRVELGEIEATLQQHEAINQAAVIAHEDEAKHKRLVAYLILHSETALSAQQLRDYLAQSLPDYMIPAIFIFLDELPVTPTGKIDRNALPAPHLQLRATTLSQQIEYPRTVLEQKIALIWQIVLHIDEISVHDNFYDLGGDSLLLVNLYSQLNKQFALSLTSLLQNLTIAQLANLLENQPASQTHLTSALSVAQLQQLAVLSLDSVPPYQPTPQRPQAILLTGATGFFGCFLLNHLLTTFPETQIYCVVRSYSENQAKQRLLDSQHRYGLNLNHRALQRLHALSGDVSLSSFDLEPQQYSQLAQQIDCIYHAAANINMLYPYETLQATNVQGTREVIQFAATIKTKPIHYLSSTAIFEATGFFAQQEPVTENVALEQCEEVYGGYAQTKWVAEKLLEQAKNKGVPINIYRLGMLTGHSKTGYANTEDMLCKLFKLFIQKGQIPKSEAIIDMLPVDYAVRAITHLSQQPSLLNQTFHLTNPNSLSFEQLANVFNEIGYPMQAIDYQQWLQQLKSMPIEAEDNALGAMLPAFTEEVAGKTYLEFSSLSLPIQADNTRQSLQDSQLSCPAINRDLLKIYFSYFEHVGFFI